MHRPTESDIWDMLWAQKDTPAPWFEHADFIKTIFDIFDSTIPLRSPILDVGCGRGKFLEYVFQQKDYHGWGADFSYKSIKSCTIPSIVSNGYCLAFASDIFYSVTSILVIEHMSDCDRFLAESYRVLKPGGCLYVVVPNFFSLVTPAMVLKKILFRDKKNFFYYRPPKKEEACEHLQQQGYQILSTAYLSIGNYLRGFERLIGCSVGNLLPEKYREEMIIICQKTDK